ncbi:MAG: hypothetical protein U0641_01140 [Anaerolineae bacterium]
MDGNLQVKAGASLTVQPTTVVKFANSGSTIEVIGTLTAQASSGNEITFTSLKDDSVGGDTNNDGTTSTAAKGDWGAIVVRASGSLNFDYVNLRYGGSGSLYYGSHYGYYGMIDASSANNASLTIRHSLLDRSQNAGLFATGSGIALTLTDSTISNNGTQDSSNQTTFFQHEGVYMDMLRRRSALVSVTSTPIVVTECIEMEVR